MLSATERKKQLPPPAFGTIFKLLILFSSAALLIFIVSLVDTATFVVSRKKSFNPSLIILLEYLYNILII